MCIIVSLLLNYWYILQQAPVTVCVEAANQKQSCLEVCVQHVKLPLQKLKNKKKVMLDSAITVFSMVL